MDRTNIKIAMSVLHVGLLIVLVQLINVYGCTTLAVGRGATIDGSTLAAHTNDGGGDTDPRLVRIPARTYPAGSMRPIYASPESYPR